MKKKIVSLLLLITMLVLPFSVKAEDNYFYADQDTAVVNNEEHNHSVFAAGEKVKSSATINGIYFGAGNEVNLSGKVSYGFLAGSSIIVDGTIDHDLFAAGGNITISKDAKITRDLYLAANDITIKSDIPGSGFITGSIVTLDNITVEGDLRVYSNQLIINENANIKGTLYVSEGTIIKNEDKLSVGNKELEKFTRLDFSTRIQDELLSILTMIFTAIVLALMFPKLFKKLDYELSVKDVFKKAFIGLGLLVIAPILSMLLLISNVGVVIGVILILLYILALMISMILVSYVIGSNLYTKLFKQKDNIYVDLLIGILVVKVIELIPYCGVLFTMFAFIYGLGLLYRYVVKESK